MFKTSMLLAILLLSLIIFGCTSSPGSQNIFVDINGFVYSCPVNQAIHDFNRGVINCIAVGGGGSGVDTNEFTAGRVDVSGIRLTDFNFGLKNLFYANDVNAIRLFQNGNQVCDKSGNCATVTPTLQSVTDVNNITDKNIVAPFFVGKSTSTICGAGKYLTGTGTCVDVPGGGTPDLQEVTTEGATTDVPTFFNGGLNASNTSDISFSSTRDTASGAIIHIFENGNYADSIDSVAFTTAGIASENITIIANVVLHNDADDVGASYDIKQSFYKSQTGAFYAGEPEVLSSNANTGDYMRAYFVPIDDGFGTLALELHVANTLNSSTGDVKAEIIGYNAGPDGLFSDLQLPTTHAQSGRILTGGATVVPQNVSSSVGAAAFNPEVQEFFYEQSGDNDLQDIFVFDSSLRPSSVVKVFLNGNDFSGVGVYDSYIYEEDFCVNPDTSIIRVGRPKITQSFTGGTTTRPFIQTSTAGNKITVILNSTIIGTTLNTQGHATIAVIETGSISCGGEEDYNTSMNYEYAVESNGNYSVDFYDRNLFGTWTAEQQFNILDGQQMGGSYLNMSAWNPDSASWNNGTINFANDGLAENGFIFTTQILDNSGFAIPSMNTNDRNLYGNWLRNGFEICDMSGNCSSGVSQTPWTSNINGADFNLFNVGGINDSTDKLSIDVNPRELIGEDGATPYLIWRDNMLLAPNGINVGGTNSDYLRYAFDPTDSGTGTISLTNGDGFVKFKGDQIATLIGDPLFTSSHYFLQVNGGGDSGDGFVTLYHDADVKTKIDGDGVIFSGGSNPLIDDTYDLGTDALRWQDLYLTGSTIHMGTSGNEATISRSNSGDKDTLISPLGDGDGFTFRDQGNGGSPPLYRWGIIHGGVDSGALFIYYPDQQLIGSDVPIGDGQPTPVKSINQFDRQLFDSGAVKSLDWGSRKLYSPGEVEVATYNGGAYDFAMESNYTNTGGAQFAGLFGSGTDSSDAFTQFSTGFDGADFYGIRLTDDRTHTGNWTTGGGGGTSISLENHYTNASATFLLTNTGDQAGNDLILKDAELFIPSGNCINFNEDSPSIYSSICSWSQGLLFGGTFGSNIRLTTADFSPYNGIDVNLGIDTNRWKNGFFSRTVDANVFSVRNRPGIDRNEIIIKSVNIADLTYTTCYNSILGGIIYDSNC